VDDTPSLFMGYVPVMGTEGNKPIPDQKKNSDVKVLSPAVNEDPVSKFVEGGPSVNGYSRLVPPANSE
jgi:hypothetical protein